MNDIKKEIGRRICSARESKKMSQLELSELIQISPSHLSDIENGKVNPGLEIIINLTEALQVSADWLLQTDVPSVSQMLDSEINSLLTGCTAAEKKVIIRIIRDLKEGFRAINK